MASAAILAGGRASRFGGRDKSALNVEGLPILDRQMAVLSKITDDVLFVVGEQTTPPRSDVRVVRDRVTASGPLGGLDAALAAARHDALTERGYHPLCAAYTRACQPAIAVRLDRGQLRMVDFLADVRVRVVCGDELAALGDHHRLLANINTPAEHEGLDRTIGHEL